MRKLYYSIISILMMLTIIFVPISMAAEEYEFKLEYSGDIVVNEEKAAKVVLKGTNGANYAKVRIKVTIEGPGTPKILATDTNGNEIDIAQTGYWGPAEGFPVQGTFENITDIKATFPTAGTYKITLSLINLEDADNAITTKTETLEVLEDKANGNEINNNVGNNTVEKLPQTGNTITEYAMCGIILASIIGFTYYKINKQRV